MKLTWHIVMKDLRRLQWALGLLFALTAMKIGVGVLALRGSNFAWNFATSGSLIVLLELLVRYVIVAAFVQEDSLVEVGTDWQTRPISGGRLLGAKLIGLVLGLVGLPLVVLVPWWVRCDFGASDIAFALGEHVAWQGAVLVIGLPLAVITKGYARFFTWSVVLLLGVLVISMVELAYARDTTPQFVEARLWVGIGLVVAVATAVTLNQFITRATRRGAWIFACGMFGAVVIAWSWTWALTRVERPVDAKLSAEGLVLKPGRLEINVSMQAGASGRQTYILRGLPADVVLGIGFVKPVYRWADGGTFAPMGTLTADLDGPRRLLGMRPADGDESNRVVVTALGTISPAQAKRLAEEAPTLSGMGQIQLRRQAMGGRHALEAGDRWSEGAKVRWISRVETDGDAIAATLLEHRPARDDSAQTVGMMVVSSEPPDGYWLVDQEKGKFLTRQATRIEAMRIGSVMIRRAELKFSARTDGVDSKVAGEDLRRLKLVRVDYTGQATVKIPVSPTVVREMP